MTFFASSVAKRKSRRLSDANISASCTRFSLFYVCQRFRASAFAAGGKGLRGLSDVSLDAWLSVGSSLHETLMTMAPPLAP